MEAVSQGLVRRQPSGGWTAIPGRHWRGMLAWAELSLKDAAIAQLFEMQVLYFINSMRGYRKHFLQLPRNIQTFTLFYFILFPKRKMNEGEQMETMHHFFKVTFSILVSWAFEFILISDLFSFLLLLPLCHHSFSFVPFYNRRFSFMP